MKRKLNLRFLGWTVTSCLVLALLMALLHQCQIRRNADVFLDHAEQALSEKQYHRAVFYLQNYLTYQPDDDEAFLKYALTMNKIALTPAARYRAFLILEQALRRAPENIELRQEAFRAALSLSRFAEAARHIQVLQTVAPNDPRLWQDLARCQEGLGEHSQARGSYEKAIALAPHDLVNFARLANLFRFQLERPSEVLPILNRMVEANPQSFEAYLTRAHYLRKSESPAEAWADIEKAEALAPDELQIILTIAEVAPEVHRDAKARQALEHGIGLYPAEESLYLLLAQMEMRNDRLDLAAACLEDGLKLIPQSSRLRIMLTDLFVHQGDLTGAETSLARLRQDPDSSEAADCLQARLFIHQKQWGQALATLNQVQPRLAKDSQWTGQVAFLLGLCHENLGDLPQAVTAYQHAIEAAPDWNQARLNYAGVLLAAGRVHEAVKQCRQVLDIPNPPPAAALLLAQTLVRINRSLPEEEQNWSEVDRVMQKATRWHVDPVRLALVQADALATRNQWLEAEDLLQAASKRHPNIIDLTLGLADLAIRHRDWEQARTYLASARADFGDVLKVRQSWLWYWTEHRGKEASQELAALAGDLAPLSADERLRFLRELAGALYRLEESGHAATIWRKLADQYPRDLHSRFALFDLALQQGDAHTMQTVLAELRRIEGEQGVLWRYGEAALLVVRDKGGNSAAFPKAKQWLAEVQNLKPEWGRAYLLRGLIEERSGNGQAAAEQYLMALDKGELHLEAVEKAVRFFFSRQEYWKAEQILNKVGDVVLLHKELAQMTAEVALIHHNYPRAVRVARAVISPQSRDYRDHLWLAKVLRQSGQFQEAETVLARAVQTAPYVPETWAAWVGLLTETGKAGKVEAILTDIPRQVPAKNVELTLARCYEESNQRDKAEAAFDRYAAAHPDDILAWRQLADYHLRHEQWAKAEPWLRKWTTNSSAIPGRLVYQARRQLAKTLAKLSLQGDPSRYQEAIDLIQGNIRQRPGDPDDQITLALVLAVRSEHQSEAVSILEKVQTLTPLAAAELFTLAQLQERDKAFSKVVQTLSRLIQLDGEKADYLAPYVKSLLSTGDVFTAQSYLLKLEALQPNQPRTQLLRAELEETRKLLEAKRPS
jgi:tetratricopeptide (TPR) repeat protein